MANTVAPSVILWSFFGGLLPTLVWLWFWLKEDPHPEPRRALFRTLAAGALAVPAALFLEQIAVRAGGALGVFAPGVIGPGILVVWALIEEVVKYIAAKKAALDRVVYDEPVDAVIYLITAALGFAAVENTLFLFRAFGETGTLSGIATGNLRFLGATLLHVVASGAVGLALAFSFFHPRSRRANLAGGLFTATILHALFNILIIKKGDSAIFMIFALLWVAAVATIFFFEKIKALRP